MLLKCDIFEKIASPWFQPENDLGTDIQICKKAKDSGYKVFLDSSQTIGHVLHHREVITEKNRHRIFSETFGTSPEEGLQQSWQRESALAMYVCDAQDYLDGMSIEKMELIGNVEYSGLQMRFNEFENKEDYYKASGNMQLCRQVWFHCLDSMVNQYRQLMSLFRFEKQYYGIDFGCGSAPLSYELAARGHKIDFIDIDGAGGYEFLKWRVKKNGIKTAGFSWGGPYDYALMLDSLEHIEDWRGVLDKIIDYLKPNGYILTNYFLNRDFNNLEHISMDHKAVGEYLVSKGVYPRNEWIWYKGANITKEEAVVNPNVNYRSKTDECNSEKNRILCQS